MALIDISNQYRYTGRGPFDAKALVKTYSELLNPDTWTVINASGKSIIAAYNGLITAVCLNKEDPSKNGIYFLYDAEATSPLKTPDVTLETNWHKLCTIDALGQINEELNNIQELLKIQEETLVDLEERSTEIVCDFATFPKEGTPNKLYIDGSTGRAYYFADNKYHEVVSSATTTITELYGGSAVI